MNYQLSARDQLALDRAARLLKKMSEKEHYLLDHPNKIVEHFKCKLSNLIHEEFHIIYLDSGHQYLDSELLAKGTLNGATIYPRSVLKACIENNACAVVFVHNHPSGITSPSDADLKLTKRLTQALKFIDISVLDHIIIGNGSHTSLAQSNLMPLDMFLEVAEKD